MLPHTHTRTYIHAQSHAHIPSHEQRRKRQAAPDCHHICHLRNSSLRRPVGGSHMRCYSTVGGSHMRCHTTSWWKSHPVPQNQKAVVAVTCSATRPVCGSPIQCHRTSRRQWSQSHAVPHDRCVAVTCMYCRWQWSQSHAVPHKRPMCGSHIQCHRTSRWQWAQSHAMPHEQCVAVTSSATEPVGGSGRSHMQCHTSSVWQSHPVPQNQ